MQRSTRTLTAPSDNWVREWTVFYFANWYAWAPIAALFLGRIAKGYSVRQFITVNLILPSCCAVLWMSTFAGSAIYFDNLLGGVFQASLATNGPESLIYMLFENLPFSSIMAVLLIIITFISFVTAADSNTDAMSRLCTSADSLSEEAGQTSMKLKFVWGITIGIIAWVMISFASLDGIRMMNSLGGLPALFIIMISNISLFILLRRVLQSGKLTVESTIN